MFPPSYNLGSFKRRACRSIFVGRQDCALTHLINMVQHIAIFVLMILSAVSVREVEMVPEYFKSMSRSLLEVLKTCSTELEIKDGIMYEIYQLWKENYDGLSRETGCVLHCMSQKLDLFNVQGKFEHGNTKEFIMKHGADSSTATQLEEMVHICQHKVGEMADECLRVLEMAKCIRGNLTQINWNPNIEVAVEEIVAEA
ncbi:hypothetical protein evm_002395 [Chilo suppressalis]|nr:hypothetical protein evm_002395 [Chilo suppressalis]